MPIRQGGQAGSTTTSQAGTGGSMTGQGAPDGATPICTSYPSCNPADQQVGLTIGSDYPDLPWVCPAERECYSLVNTCGSVLCVVPEDVHCNDLACNPGDTLKASYADCDSFTKSCYQRMLCAQSIVCETWRITACSGTSSDGGLPEPQDASADGDAAGRIPCCGDGIVDWDHGEECDFGVLNDVPLDTSSSSWIANPDGIVWCDSNCRNPHPLCVPTSKLGGIFCD